MNIYIDFDYTISPNGYSIKPQEMELPPYPGAIGTIQRFKKLGYNIIIFSCRANPEVVGPEIVARKIKEMEDYLKAHQIPYDSVFTQKPNYDVVIDDKAIGFHDNWNEINEKF